MPGYCVFSLIAVMGPRLVQVIRGPVLLGPPSLIARRELSCPWVWGSWGGACAGCFRAAWR